MSSTSASNGSDDRSDLEAGEASVDAGSERVRDLRNLTDQQKMIIAVALVVHMIVAALTLRDLRQRPAAAIRGPKLLWGAWIRLNTTGSMAYWLFARRRPSDPL